MSSLVNYLPVFTTPAGSCLTTANWLEAGVEKAVFCLAALCIRPGIPVLMAFDNLRHYGAWPGTIIVNLTALYAARTPAGDFHIRSMYDGSYLTISTKNMLALIQHLQPDYVILPEHIGASEWLPESMCGQVLRIGKNQQMVYQVDDLSQPMHHDLQTATTSAIWWESDRAALKGMRGHWYGQMGEDNILDSVHRTACVPLMDGCDCPICQQGFTRAYLHHLFQQTPLLAQRLLIMHNVFYMTEWGSR